MHTGQHYDDSLSSEFFHQLDIPAPNIELLVGSQSHAVQTARIMERLEPVLLEQSPDWTLVYGDVNSTVAAALVAAKLRKRVAHVEAGLRSHDRTMPEEINRIVTDRVADLLFTPSRDADAALRSEGEPEDEIVFVGNVMIDSLFFALKTAGNSIDGHEERGKAEEVVVTLHRPSNVDDEVRFTAIARALRTIAEERPVIFPMHPRTKARAENFGIDLGRVQVTAPLPYVPMLRRVAQAHSVVTDSGGLQEETTALGVPCLTLRPNTERPVTIVEGTNRLVPDPYALPAAVKSVNRDRSFSRPEGWDGKAAERIVAALIARP